MKKNEFVILKKQQQQQQHWLHFDANFIFLSGLRIDLQDGIPYLSINPSY